MNNTPKRSKQDIVCSESSLNLISPNILPIREVENKSYILNKTKALKKKLQLWNVNLQDIQIKNNGKTVVIQLDTKRFENLRFVVQHRYWDTVDEHDTKIEIKWTESKDEHGAIVEDKIKVLDHTGEQLVMVHLFRTSMKVMIQGRQLMVAWWLENELPVIFEQVANMAGDTLIDISHPLLIKSVETAVQYCINEQTQKLTPASNPKDSPDKQIQDSPMTQIHRDDYCTNHYREHTK